MRTIQKVLLIPAILLLVSACSPKGDGVEVLPPQDAKSLARGKELVNGLAACGYCHGGRSEPGSLPVGGRVYKDRYGEVRAANITPARSGIGEWSVPEIARAVRSSRAKDGRYLSEQAHEGYEWMSDRDLLSIAAYLQSLPPIENDVERRTVSRWARNTTGFFEHHDEQDGFVPELPRKYQAAYGKYLIDHVARCGSCHNSQKTMFSEELYLAGGQAIESGGEQKVAPALSGDDSAAKWSEDQIVHYLRTGETPDGRTVDPGFCPVNFYGHAADGDLRAIAAYLTTR